MRFLADENVESITIEWLRGQGHDVSAVCESMPTTADADLLDVAVAQGRVIVTYDTDFGDLVYRQRLAHVGVVLLRLTASDAADRLARIREHSPLIEHGCRSHFLVVKDDRARTRPMLPNP